jgi:energy-coupling factor transporter ATP-binding protein EcfA2
MNIDNVQLVIIRGLPGSGKSTLAKEIAALGFEHIENDQFFICQNGEYRYDPRRIGDAIRYCEDKTYKALGEGKRIVVSNTFIRNDHWLGFVAEVDFPTYAVIEMYGQYGNIHDVPQSVVDRMASEWEYYDGAIKIGKKS